MGFRLNFLDPPMGSTFNWNQWLINDYLSLHWILSKKTQRPEEGKWFSQGQAMSQWWSLNQTPNRLIWAHFSFQNIMLQLKFILGFAIHCGFVWFTTYQMAFLIQFCLCWCKNGLAFIENMLTNGRTKWREKNGRTATIFQRRPTQTQI